MRVGEIIRKYRDEHGLTTAEFARRAGLSRPYVYMLEVNRNTNGGKPIEPSTATLLKVSKAINIPLTDLINLMNDEVLPQPALTADHAKVLGDFDALDDAGKDMIRNMLTALRHTHAAAV